MVERHLIMEEEDDLEALRLAALQTIRSRQGVRRPTASVTAHRHVEKSSFFRHTSNPNLIAIVPTDPKSDSELTDLSPVRNGVGANVSERSTQKNEKNGKENESFVNEDSEEKGKLKVRFRTGGKPEREKIDEITGEDSKNSKGRVPTKKDSSEEVSGNENVNFDEDELDFEGDTVALHDDEDSLDRLMDEMEQEFNEGNSSLSCLKSIQNKEKEIKPTNKISAANSVTSKTVKTSATSSSSSSASQPQKVQSATAPQRTKSRSPTPNTQSSGSEVLYPPVSPTYSPWDYPSSPVPRRRYSPLSPSRRRSPSPRIKRRRSLTPPRRYSRSPVNSKSSVFSKYSRARSPYKNKHNGRRTPESPRRRNSSSSPYRRCSVRSPPLVSKRKASPMFHAGKRKSSSPSLSGRHRRSPKRSPSRIGAQTVESKHRWRSRSPHHHRKISSLKKRDLSSRNTRNPKQTSPPIQRADDKLSRIEKKSINVLDSKVAENPEKKQKDEWKPQELTDPKFEARRKKFESSVFVTPGNKKICLKSNDDQSQTGEVRKEISDENSVDNVEINNSLQKSSKPVLDVQKKKLYTQEIPSGRKVTELKREATESPPPSKKKIVISEGGCLKKRLDISSLVVSAENQHNSKGTLSVTKYYDERNVTRSPETVKSIITLQNDLIENDKDVGIPAKKVLKKKKKNKELKKRKEITPEDVEQEKELSIESKEEKEKEINVTSTINKSSFDLRAELSRRRAERLKGVTNPMARIVQSAFEDVVANRKKFESKSSVQDNDLMSTSCGLTFLNAKRSRRVHLLEGSSGIKSKSALNSNFDVDDEIASDHVDFTDSQNGRKVAMNFPSQKNSSSTSLRTSSAGSGRSILRRSQV